MLNKEMVLKWSQKLSSKLGRSVEEIEKDGLSAYDFSPSQSVEVRYSETSLIKFDHAFVVINEESQMLAVFTEHYGYHEFSTYGALVTETKIDLFVDENYDGAIP